MSLNKVQLIGNLGSDPEMKYTQSGTPVMNMRLACTEKYTDKDGERKEKTEWVDCVMWGKRAEALCKHLTRGQKVYVEGTYTTREWEDKQGNKRRSTEVNIGMKGDLRFLGGGQQQGGQRQEEQQRGGGWDRDSNKEAGGGGFADDDIPF